MCRAIVLGVLYGKKFSATQVNAELTNTVGTRFLRGKAESRVGACWRFSL
ncbi:hypothetical protein CFELI_10145 [Corynebacterium felinum]|nr:hypothetical protein CFELI_10145 [Corynebacterium felinum]